MTMNLMVDSKQANLIKTASGHIDQENSISHSILTLPRISSTQKVKKIQDKVYLTDPKCLSVVNGVPQNTKSNAMTTFLGSPPASIASQPHDTKQLIIYMYPEDAKDKLLSCCIKVLMKLGNKPTTANEIMTEISQGRWMSDDLSFNKHSTAPTQQQLLVNNAVSQHIKRCAESNPKRSPLVAKCTWESENRRKTRYYLTVPGIPVFSEKDVLSIKEVPLSITILKTSNVELCETTQPSLLSNQSLAIALSSRAEEMKSSPLQTSYAIKASVLQEALLNVGVGDEIPSSPPLSSPPNMSDFKNTNFEAVFSKLPDASRPFASVGHHRTRSEEIRINMETVSISDLDDMFGNSDDENNDSMAFRRKRSLAKSLPGTPVGHKKLKLSTSMPLPKLKIPGLPALKLLSKERPKSALATLSCSNGFDLLVHNNETSDSAVSEDVDATNTGKGINKEYRLLTGKRAQELYDTNLAHLNASTKVWCEKQRLPFVNWSAITVVSAMVPENSDASMPVFFGTVDGAAVFFVILSKLHKKGAAKSPLAIKAQTEEPLYSVCLMRHKQTDMVNASVLLYASGIESARERNLVLSLERGRAKCRNRASSLFGTWLPVNRTRKLGAACFLLDDLPPLFCSIDLVNQFQQASKAFRNSKMSQRKASPSHLQTASTAGVSPNTGMLPLIYPVTPATNDAAAMKNNLASSLAKYSLSMPATTGQTTQAAVQNSNVSRLPILYPYVSEGKVQGLIADPKVAGIIGDHKVSGIITDPKVSSIFSSGAGTVKPIPVIGECNFKTSIPKPEVSLLAPGGSKPKCSSGPSSNVSRSAEAVSASTANYQITLPKGGSHHRHGTRLGVSSAKTSKKVVTATAAPPVGPVLGKSASSNNNFFGNGFPPVIIPPFSLLPSVLGKSGESKTTAINESLKLPSTLPASTAANTRNVGNISHLYAAFPLLFNPFANQNAARPLETQEKSDDKPEAVQTTIPIDSPRLSLSPSTVKYDGTVQQAHDTIMPTSIYPDILSSGISPSSLSTVDSIDTVPSTITSFVSLSADGALADGDSVHHFDFHDDEELEEDYDEYDNDDDASNGLNLIDPSLLYKGENPKSESVDSAIEDDEDSEIDVVGL